MGYERRVSAILELLDDSTGTVRWRDSVTPLHRYHGSDKSGENEEVLVGLKLTPMRFRQKPWQAQRRLSTPSCGS